MFWEFKGRGEEGRRGILEWSGMDGWISESRVVLLSFSRV